MSNERLIHYRPDIDGLRAVAVSLVVLFHAWPKWIKSGFIGVDVFFVISGYLITSIILKDLNRESFSIRTFYVRRIRRIFPALLTVLVFTFGFGWYVLLHHEFTQLGKHVAGAATFVSNLVLWNESGYFDNDHATKPLLHFWSLGVEEQFYLVWPLMLAMFFRLRGGILLVLSAALAASFVYGLYTTWNAPAEAYFSPIARFWELACGGVIAHVLAKKEVVIPTRQLLSVAGAGLLVLGALLIDSQSPFPGTWALLPVLGTCALIVAGPDCSINKYLLGNPLMAYVGRISYPFYLWHWPLLSFGYIISGEKPPALAKLTLVGAALVLAVLTYHLIERPVQRQQRHHRVIGGLLAAMLAFGVIGLGAQSGMLRERIDTNGADRYLRALNDLGFPHPAMKPLRYGESVFQQLHGQGRGTTVLLGDSVMEQYAPLVADGLASGRFDRKAVVFATAGGCPPIRGAVKLPLLRFPHCGRTVDDGYRLAAAPHVDTVAIAAIWYGYFSAANRDVKVQAGAHTGQFPSPAAHEMAYASLLASVRQLRQLGKRVFIILQPPTGDAFDPRSMIAGSRFDQVRPRAQLAPYQVGRFRQDNAAPRARLTAIAQQTGSIIVDPADHLCRDGTCPVVGTAGEPIYTDPVHMRPYFVRSAVHYLDDALRSAVPPPRSSVASR